MNGTQIIPKKRTLTAILAALLLLPTFASCADNTPDEIQASTQASCTANFWGAFTISSRGLMQGGINDTASRFKSVSKQMKNQTTGLNRKLNKMLSDAK